MNTTLARRVIAPVVTVVVVAIVAIGAVGCPLDNGRDGIGRACNVDGDVCPLDHTCLPEDAEAPGSGSCAPILDYGSCPVPTYPQKASETIDEDGLLVDAPGDVDKLEGVATIEGDLTLDAEGLGLLDVGDLCALAGVQHIDGRLIVNSTDITTLDGLQGLAFVKDGILIHGNRDLEDVMGLVNIVVAEPPTDREFGIAIANNNSLTEAALQELKTALATSAPTVRIFDCGNQDSPVPRQTCGALVTDLLRD